MMISGHLDERNALGGVGSKTWGLAPGGMSTFTSTRSPPTFRTISARGKMLAVTLILSPGGGEDVQFQRKHRPKSSMSVLPDLLIYILQLYRRKNKQGELCRIEKSL
jgi:hypothetical protein